MTPSPPAPSSADPVKIREKKENAPGVLFFWSAAQCCAGVPAHGPPGGAMWASPPTEVYRETVRWGRPPGRPAPVLHRTLPAGHTGPALQVFSVGRDPCVPPHTAALANPVIASQCAHWCGDPHPLVPCHQCPQMPTESSALLSCAHKNCPACRIGIPSGRRGFCFFERSSFRLTGPGRPPECRRWHPRHRCRR